MSRFTLFGYAVLAILLVFGTSGFASVLVVSKTADTADGVCDMDCSLREAITAAVNGDSVVFSPLFNIPQTISLTNGQIAITQDLTIAGPGQTLLTVSGNNTSRIFRISDGAIVTLTGLKISNGRVTSIDDFRGGGIYVTDSTLNLILTTVTDNYARTNPGPMAAIGYGGGIASINSVVSIISSTVSRNIIPDPFPGIGEGAGLWARFGTINIMNATISSNFGEGLSVENSNVSVENSLVSENGRIGLKVSGNLSVRNSTVRQNGGGISVDSSSGSLLVDHSLITSNARGIYNQGIGEIRETTISNCSHNGGGGILNLGLLRIYNSTINGNTGYGGGGGIMNTNTGILFLTNSTVSGNAAANGSFPTTTGSGGGIFNSQGAQMTLTNVTLTGNTATGNGGGIFHDSTGGAIVRNTIIAGNTNTSASSPDVFGNGVSTGFNLIGNPTGSSGWLSSDLLNQDPLLVPLGNNGGPTLTHALRPNSVAINAGSNLLGVDPVAGLPLNRDQRGRGRRHGCIPVCTTDIGAYEAAFAGQSPSILSGRVQRSEGRGIGNVQLTLTDTAGNALYARTNPFGHYRFYNLPPGATYTLAVTHKSHRFGAAQFITIDYSRFDLNFYPE